MKILLIQDNGFIADPLRKLLISKKHDLSVLTTDQSKLEILQHSGVHAIFGNPAENGQWINALASKYDYIINLYTPVPETRLNYSILENKYDAELSKIAQNITYIAEKTSATRIFQIIPPNFYGDVSTGTISEKAPVNPNSLAYAFQGLIRHFQGFKPTASTLIILPTFIYSIEGKTLPKVPLIANKIHPIFSHGENWISLVHLDDLVAAIDHLIENKFDQSIINLCDDKPIMQKDWIKMLSRISFLPHPLPIPASLANIIYGEVLTKNITNSAKLKNELLKSTGYWLKYPDYQAGLAKFLVAM